VGWLLQLFVGEKNIKENKESERSEIAQRTGPKTQGLQKNQKSIKKTPNN